MNGRYIKKRIHVRVEHVSPSRCHDEFLRRCKENDEARHAAKVSGTPAPPMKRQPKGPRTEGFTLENVKMETITAVPYDILKVCAETNKSLLAPGMRALAWPKAKVLELPRSRPALRQATCLPCFPCLLCASTTCCWRVLPFPFAGGRPLITHGGSDSLLACLLLACAMAGSSL